MNKIVIIWILGSSLAGSIYGQGSMPDEKTLSNLLENYIISHPFEELYLHTDRETYAAGETVRIKAYLLSYPDLRLADKESYAYAEILDCFNRPVAQVILSLDHGSGEGVMALPDTLVTGSYFLRAYTGLMRNYLPYGCFMKRITVINPFKSRYLDFLTDRKFRNDTPSHVIFLPEGEDLITGIENVVGMVTLNKYGYPVSCKGRVIADNDSVIAEVNTDSTGIASFKIIPSIGTKYFFTAVDSEMKYPLPDASGNGLTVRVTRTDEDFIKITVKNSGEEESVLSPLGMLIIRSGSRISYSEKISSQQPEYRAIVPVKMLARGINNIVIFDNDGNVACERFVYIAPPDRGSPVLNLTHQSARREKIRVNMSDIVPATGNMSASISVSAPSPGRPALLATEYLVLGSEIILPLDAFPLRELFPTLSSEAKNIVLLGARSCWIDWKKLVSGNNVKQYYGEERDGRFLYITIPEPNNINGKNIKAYLTAFGLRPSFQYATKDTTGRFTFFLEKKDNPDDLIIKLENDGITLPMKIESRFSDNYIMGKFIADTTSGTTGINIERLLTRYQVRKIYGLTDTCSIYLQSSEEPSPVPLYDKPDQRLMLDDYISLSSMREIFFELIKRMVVRSGRKDEGDVIFDPTLKRNPALFIDYVAVDDAEAVLNLNPAHVRQIDVIFDDYMVGDIVFPGIVSVITREGTFNDVRLPDNSVRIAFKMYDLPRSFITPDYSNDEARNSRLPDFRNTLFWSGEINRDSSGNIFYEFWGSDDTDDYEVSVNIITDTGEIISARSTLTLTGIL